MRFIFVLLVLIFSSLSIAAPSEGEQKKCTTEMVLDGVIGPASLDSIQRAKLKSKEWGCDSLLLLINTPGGSLQSTRIIVEEILNSPIPILCLVYPSGGHAGSAGAIILQACHVSGAMAATNIGAATPISSTGQEMAKDLRKKILNDTLSWLEGMTNHRKRNLEFSKKIISEAKAVSAEEAFRLKAIDHMAKTKEDFLSFANGRKVKMTKNMVGTVSTGEIKLFKKDLREKILSLTGDPQTAYMMFMGSLALLYFEITHPGMIAPGVIGGIGLVFALISLHKLDVMWGGVLLLFLGMAFMVAEAFVPSFGMLGIGGMVSFVVGSLFLFDVETSGHELPAAMIFSTSIILGAVTFGISYLAFSTRNIKAVGAFEDLIGHEAVVSHLDVESNVQGQIKVLGEIWKFTSDQPVEVGDKVTVQSADGLTFNVKKNV